MNDQQKALENVGETPAHARISGETPEHKKSVTIGAAMKTQPETPEYLHHKIAGLEAENLALKAQVRRAENLALYCLDGGGNWVLALDVLAAIGEVKE
jgi:hypothetical protein